MIPRSDSEHLSDFTGADSEIHYFEDAHEKFTTIYQNGPGVAPENGG